MSVTLSSTLPPSTLPSRAGQAGVGLSGDQTVANPLCAKALAPPPAEGGSPSRDGKAAHNTAFVQNDARQDVVTTTPYGFRQTAGRRSHAVEAARGLSGPARRRRRWLEHGRDDVPVSLDRGELA